MIKIMFVFACILLNSISHLIDDPWCVISRCMTACCLGSLMGKIINEYNYEKIKKEILEFREYIK